MTTHIPRRGIAALLPLVLIACSATPAPPDVEPAATSTSRASISPSVAPPVATPVPATPIGSVRLDRESCHLEDLPEALEAGDFVIEAANHTGERAAFDLFRIGAGGSVQGLVEHVETERLRAEAGESFAGPPPWADHVAGSQLMAAGEATELSMHLEDGTYAVICLWNFVETSDPVRPFAVAGPIEVGTAAGALCRTTEPDCIGPLEPGPHRAERIDIPIAYEVAEGWAIVHEDVGVVLLDRLSDAAPAGDGDAPTTPFEPGGFVVVAIDPRIAVQDPCGHAPEPGIGATVDDLVGWLTSHDGLEASDPIELTLGGRRAVSLDIVKASGWTPACSEGVSLFVHDLTSGFWWWIDDRTAERIVLVELDEDRVGLILFEAVHREFDAAVEAAMPVIQSIRFGNQGG